MNKEPDPIFLIIAHSMMKNSEMPSVITNSEMPSVITNVRTAVRKYFAECLARSAEGVSLHASVNETVRATLDLVILYYNTDDIGSEVENVLEAAGVETEFTGSIAAKTPLNRFSGLDIQ